MDRLKGRTILIGRDEKVSNLCIAVKETGKSKSVGNPGTLPYSISRCFPKEGKGHAKIEVDEGGNLVLYNMNPENVTYVGDVEISKCKVNPEDVIALGGDKIRFSISKLLTVAKDLLPALPVDISHLKDVYEKFMADKALIAEEREAAGKRRMLPIMVSSSSGVLTAIAAAVLPTTLWVTVPVSGVVSYLYFRNYRAKDNTRLDEEALKEKFQNDYVCPECLKFMGFQSYERLLVELKDKRDGKLYCSKCKCQLTAK